MANKFYGAISHIGGADGDLDAITSTVLADADGAFVLDAANNTIDVYTLVASSAAVEDAVNFTVIVPDDEAASPGKRWVKVAVRSFDGTNHLDIQSYVDQDVSSGASPTLDAANITGAPADFIDAITEIAAALKTGADLKLVTGTAGANTDLAVWNADGDVVSRALNTIGVLNTAAEWTAQQNFNEDTVTSSGNAVAWDWDTDQVTLHTLTENTTISAPTNANVGSIAYLRVVQAAGLYTLAWNAAFDWGNQGTPSEPAANGDSVLFGFYYDGTNYRGVEIHRKEA